MFNPVKDELAFAFHNIVEFGADFVIVGFAAVDIDRVSPAFDVVVTFAE